MDAWLIPKAVRTFHAPPVSFRLGFARMIPAWIIWSGCAGLQALFVLRATTLVDGAWVMVASCVPRARGERP